MTQTVHGLMWEDVAARHHVAKGWGVGDGWADIVDRLLTDLEALGWRWTPMTRLEEKYGELRFEAGDPRNPPTYDGWPREWEVRVEEAEEESVRTCWDCGRPAHQVVIRDWIWTLCAACTEQRQGSSP